MVIYHVVAGSPVARGVRIPRWASPSLIVRAGVSMRPQFAGRIEAGDTVYLFAAPRSMPVLGAFPARLIAPVSPPAFSS